jgi:hypothetical protein
LFDIPSFSLAPTTANDPGFNMRVRFARFTVGGI